MFDVGGGELLLIVLAILVLFGPKKIPEVATMVGKGMRKVRQAQDEFTQHLRDISTEMENASEPKTAINNLPEAEVLSSPEIEDLRGDSPLNSIGNEVSEFPDLEDSSASSVDPPALDEEPAAKPTIVIQPSQGSVAR